MTAICGNYPCNRQQGSAGCALADWCPYYIAYTSVITSDSTSPLPKIDLACVKTTELPNERTMTNKETATMLRSIRELFSVSYPPESIVALSKAIELIEQMPDEHGDLIDRDKLLKEIEMYHVSDGWLQLWLECQDAVIAAERKKDE